MNGLLNISANTRYGMVGLSAFSVLTVAGYLTLVNYAFPNAEPLLSQVKLVHVVEVVGLLLIGVWFFRASQKRSPVGLTGAPRVGAESDAAVGRETHEAQSRAQHANRAVTPNAGSSEAEDRFALVLRTFDIATFYCDLQHRYTWSHNFIGDPATLIGKADHDVLPEATAEILTALKVRAIADGGMQSGELKVDIGHEVRTYSVQVAPRRNAMGHIIGTLAVSCDITEKTVWQDHLLLMMREVNHRARNMLAIVASVCRMTEKNADSLRQYRDKVSGRVMSLAATMDIVSKDNWVASSVRKLISAQLSIVPHEKARRINVRGDDVLIQSKAGQNIGLALHELLSNAIEHGALNDPKGEVDLLIDTKGDQDGGGIRLVWRETLSRPRPEKKSNGFGLQALEMILATELDGTCAITWQPAGMSCELSLPASVLGVDNAYVAAGAPQERGAANNVMIESLSGKRVTLDPQ